MFIIADKLIPESAKDRLAKYGELIEFETSGITDDTISGHPDIFFYQANGKIVTAPNLPDVYRDLLYKRNIPHVTGRKSITKEYPGCAAYNAVSSNDYLIHRLDITEDRIKEYSVGRKEIDVMQGFTRCSLLPVKGNRFITSDKGIYKKLSACKLEVTYIDPFEIILPGHKHGFFGGCCGVYEENIFILGSLMYTPGGKEIRDYLKSLKYEVIELYKGPLFDGGSILFIDKK